MGTALSPPRPTPDAGAAGASGEFAVRLDNFEGPFDLLLSLISRQRLDITEIALAQVTDEFVAYLSGREDWPLDQASQFLVVAATLLDLKAARLLPSGSTEDDEEDLALLEARDLLFARLLQYRAYKDVVGVFSHRMETVGRSYPRAVQLEPQLVALLPEVLLGLGPDQLAALAATVLSRRPAPPPAVATDHIHVPRVNVAEQAELILDRLRREGTATFRALVADAPDPIHVVGRFLALLDLYREGLVGFEQAAPLGDLLLRWTGAARVLGPAAEQGPAEADTDEGAA